MINNYNKHNEGIRNLLVGPTDEEVKDYIKKNPDHALLTHCKNGNVELVKLALESGADPNYYERRNCFPLMYACGKNSFNMDFNIDILKLLIEYNVDLSTDRNLCLRECCFDYNEESWDNLEIIKMLLDAGADVHSQDNLCMSYAKSHRQPKLINLLEKYYDNYGVEEYEEVKEIEPKVSKFKQFMNKFKHNENNNLDVEYNCKECGWKGWIPMTKIVKCPNCGNINDVWKDDEPTPKRHKELYKKYLNSKSNEGIKHLLTGPSKEELYDNMKDWTAYKIKNVSIDKDWGDGLRLAFEKDNSLIEPLINNEQYFRNMIIQGQIEIVRVLLDYGTNPNMWSGDPLIKSVEHGNYEMTKLLLDYGADPDKCYLELINRAKKRGFDEISELLKQYSKKDLNEGIKHLLVGPTEEEIKEYQKQSFLSGNKNMYEYLRICRKMKIIPFTFDELNTYYKNGKISFKDYITLGYNLGYSELCREELEDKIGDILIKIVESGESHYDITDIKTKLKLSNAYIFSKIKKININDKMLLCADLMLISELRKCIENGADVSYKNYIIVHRLIISSGWNKKAKPMLDYVFSLIGLPKTYEEYLQDYFTNCELKTIKIKDYHDRYYHALVKNGEVILYSMLPNDFYIVIKNELYFTLSNFYDIHDKIHSGIKESLIKNNLNDWLGFNKEKYISFRLSNFKEVYNILKEGIKHLLTGPTEEQVLDNLKDNPQKLLNYSIRNDYKKGADIALEKGANVNRLITMDRFLLLDILNYSDEQIIELFKYDKWCVMGYALHNKRYGIIKTLLNNGFKFQEKEKEDLFNNNFEVFEYINNNIQIIIVGADFIKKLIIEDRLEDIKKLVKMGSFDIYWFGKYLLKHANSVKAWDVVNYLNSINININEGIKHLLVGPTDDEVSNFLKTLPPNEKLSRASKIGNFEMVVDAIEKGADIHYDNDCALRYFNIHSIHSIDITDYLLKNGGDVHFNEDYLIKRAVTYNKPKLVKYLIDNGADIHTELERPLKIASRDGHLEIVKLLIDNGADVKLSFIRDAEQNGHKEICGILKRKYNEK